MRQSHDSKHAHFLKEIEQAIRLANCEVLGNRLKPITKDTILPLAVSVAKLRGDYLAEAFRLASSDKGRAFKDEEINGLKKYRQSYEEARRAFEALTLAIDRGYVEIAE
ncbi:MAG: hypothetical protein HYW28_09880 [Rhodospirillales bacterium]|nr:hypothetical protein [Rhodospirillales bacterium]MBI2586160.1 hypothetical protein [Rhodospirillales bacterium]MBI2978333.1 hypothetical protein [Rhodospirillales bacterium]